MWNGIGWYGFIGVITTSTTDISLVMGVISNECELWKIYHAEYVNFIATDRLKTKESWWVLGL